MQPSTRRQFLAATGTAALGGLAGCSGGRSNRDETAGIATGTADWPMLGHDYAHTGYAPDEAGPSDDPEVVWQHDVGLARGNPVVVGDNVLAPAGEGLSCYRLEDGEPRWRDTPDDDAWTTPTVVDGRVFVASGHGGLRVLDLESGDHLLSVPLPGYVSAPPTPDRRNRRLYVATDAGTVHAFPLEFGEPLWTRELYGQFRVAVSPTPYGVFAATSGGDIYCLDPDDGRGRWRTKLPGEITAAPVAITGDVVVSCFDGKLYRLDGQRAGEPEWEAERGGFLRGSLSVAGGTVFGAHGSEVVAVDAASGEEEWAASVGGQAGGAIAVAGDTLYVGSFGDEVHAFDLDGPDGVGPIQFGGRKWTASVPGGCGEGAAVANGTLVTMGQGGEDEPSRIVAFR